MQALQSLIEGPVLVVPQEVPQVLVGHVYATLPREPGVLEVVMEGTFL